MINNIKHTEKTLNFKTTLTKSEKDNWQGQRSIILKRNVKKGEKVNADTITTKRPFYPSSIHAKDYLDLVEKNCIFTQDLNKDDFLEWKQITN